MEDKACTCMVKPVASALILEDFCENPDWTRRKELEKVVGPCVGEEDMQEEGSSDKEKLERSMKQDDRRMK